MKRWLLTVLRSLQVRGFPSPPVATSIALFLGVVVVITFFFPRGNTQFLEYSEGSIWIESDLIAPMDFPIYHDPLAVEKKRKAAFDNTSPSFDQQKEMVEASQAMIVSLGEAMKAFQSSIQYRGKKNAPEMLALADSLAKHLAAKNLAPPLGADEWAALSTHLARSESAPKLSALAVQTACEKIAKDVYRRGYLDREKSSLPLPSIVISVNGIEEPFPKTAFLDRSEVDQLIRSHLLANPQLPPDVIPSVIALSRWLIRPDIVYNTQRTEVARQAAMDIVPTTIGIVKRNERIVARHQRVTPELKAKLDSYQLAVNERIGRTEMIMRLLGKAAHVTALIGLFVLYLFFFRKKIIASTSRLALIAVIIIMVAFMAWLSFTIKSELPLEYLILVPIASMLLTIIFDSRVAFYGTVICSLLAGAIRGNDYAVILSSLLGGALALFTVRDIKHRTQMFRSLAFIFLGYAFAIGIDSLQRLVPLSEVSVSIGFAFVNAVLSPVITYGILIFFERFFSISTDLTLLELSDFNHPLMQQLSRQAPGTFHHSVVMGTLAETAASAIHANAILARVGAYYHDIGKLTEATLFVENQRGEANPHDSMEPTDSAKLIIAHVNAGIAAAERARLPERIVRFIPTHHGTTVASFFYEKARQVNPEIDRALFRYPGPKPQTKEEGIVMLADSIEATVRSIDEPNRENIERLVDSIVAKRVADGELDDCELTVRDLHEVKRAFSNILEGIHHSRIKYPGDEEDEDDVRAAERTALLLKLPPAAEALARRVKKISES